MVFLYSISEIFNMMWLCFLFLVLVVSDASDPHKYRDYVYNRKTMAYYKLHIEENDKYDSEVVCRVEGSALMLPTSAEDIAQVHGMLKEYPDIGNLVWIEGEEEYDSAEIGPEVPSSRCNALNRYQGEVEDYYCYQLLPFVCKVDAKDAPYDDQCNVYAQGYDYFPSIASCYKIIKQYYIWDQAYNECQQEGAHLVVINSEAERKVVWDLVKVAQRSRNKLDSYFVGVRAERTDGGRPREFQTIFRTNEQAPNSLAKDEMTIGGNMFTMTSTNVKIIENLYILLLLSLGHFLFYWKDETLDQAGYNKWSFGEPDNYLNSEYCGAISYQYGKFNDVNCNSFHAFICEKEVPRRQ